MNAKIEGEVVLIVAWPRTLTSEQEIVNMKTRRRASALLLSPENKLFLFKFEFAFLDHGKTLWVTPGGGVNERETFEQGLQRELFEELGIDITVVGPHVFFREMPFTSKTGEEFVSDERYYIVNITDENVLFDNMSAVERQLTKEGRWWSIDDIRSSSEEFFTDDLDDILEDIINGNLASFPLEI